MITILTDKAVSNRGQDMYELLVKKRDDVKLFCLGDIKIEPCYACRACEEKTYGRCIIRDDADLVLPCLSHSEIIIVFSPIVFGGYSFQIKRAVDKFGLVLDRHYHCHHGELVKGKPLYGKQSTGAKYYVIGVQGEEDMEELQVFKQLVMETITIASWTGRAIVLPHDAADYDRLIQEIIEL